MFGYLTDFVIIFMQIVIVAMLLRWIKLLLDVQRDIKINKYKSLREVIKHAKEEDQLL